MRVRLEHLLVRGARLVQLSKLEEGPSVTVARFDVLDGDVEDLLVQVGRSLPVGLERRGDSLIRERTHAEGGLCGCWHVASSEDARERGRTDTMVSGGSGTLPVTVPYLSDLQHRRVLDAGGDQLGHLRARPRPPER
ncbi:MAG: hypothetical protein HYY42_02620 [Chloroflexi bacterium]|nr:hypothetical protein [Chloroflexota bacterium]